MRNRLQNIRALMIGLLAQLAMRVCIALILSGSLLAGDNPKFLGNQEGYDEALLRNYLNLSDRRLLLDLAGEWTVTINGMSTQLKVPSNYDYSGKVVYRRTFTPGPEFTDKHFRFVSWGINFSAEIRINDEFIATQVGGYLHREIDLNEDLIRINEPNTIEITVNSVLDVQTSIPRYSTVLQPKAYGGIFREIFLIATPKLTLDRFTINTQISHDQKKCEFTVGLNIRNYDFGYHAKDSSRSGSMMEHTTDVRYLIEVFTEDEFQPLYTNRYKLYRNVWEIPKVKELNSENRVQVGGFVNFEKQFVIEKPIFWTPENPYRYKLVLTILKSDTLVDQIQSFVGISKSEVQESNILLNSQPIIARGIEYYEDFPDAGHRISQATMEADILKMKALGINVIYHKHHPPHPYFLELCNRYGLLVMYEPPIMNFTISAMSQHAYLEDVKNYYKVMIDNDRMNPCVLAWGLGSGNDQTEKEASAFLNLVIQMCRTLDDRPVFCTSVFGAKDVYLDQVDIINLELRSNDFLTANLFAGKSLSRWPNRAVLCTYGAQIFPNNQNGYSDPTSTKFQAKFLIDVAKKLNEWKVAGGIVRSYNDFVVNRSYVFGYPNYDQTIYTSGLVTFQRKERYAYEFVKAFNSGDKLENIPIGNFENPYPKTYPIVGLILVVVFLIFYRQSGRFSNSVFRSITKIMSFFSDVRESRVITLWPAIVVGFLTSLSLAALTSLIFYELRRNQVFDQFIANVVVSTSWKGSLDALSWSPELFVITFTLIIFIAFLLLGIFIRTFSFVFRYPINFQQSIIAGFWSGGHYLLLLPCVIVFQRLMRVDFFMTTAIVILAITIFWHITRLFRIIKIVYESTWLKTIVIFGSLLTILVCLVSYEYSSRYDAFSLMDYLEKIYQSKNYSMN